MLGWSMIAGKRNAVRGLHGHLQAKWYARRSRRAAHPANKVQIAHPETPKRNGLLT
jgi:hypothetical protein